MKYYTETIPYELYLKYSDAIGQFEKTPTYAEVFDWLMEKGYRIMVQPKLALNPIKLFLCAGNMLPEFCIIEGTEDCNAWREAANAAIEKALTLI